MAASDEQSVLQEFREQLKKFKEFDWNDKLAALHETFNGKNKKLLSKAEDALERNLNAIKVVDLMSDSQLRYHPDWMDKLEYINSILKETFLAASGTNFVVLTALMPRLKSALKSFASLKEFKNNISIDIEESKNALEDFIKVGELIRSNDAEYRNSRIYSVESLLLNRQETLRTLIKPQNMPDNTRTEYSFIALAAPSMEGKTQTAFTFNRVKPLYFPVSGAQPTDQANGGSPQKIYQNFSNLSECLAECAKSDFIGPSKPRKYLHSASSILQKRKNKKFWTLGFLKKLAQESSKMADNQPWMHFHATRPNFAFEPVSIAEIEEQSPFDGYVLFLDEFVGNSLFVFVRNLARAAKIPCILANTNTRIANVVGTETSSGQSLDFQTWSIVITKLDPASKSVLDQTFQLENSIQRIKQGRRPDDSVCLFLDHFIENQLQHLRPGVATFVSGILKTFVENKPITKLKLGPLLDHICDNLKRKLMARKRSLTSNIFAKIGRLALLVPESYRGYHQPHDCPEFRDTRFLEHHLFYLENPSDANNWIFLTFPGTFSEDEDKILNICPNGELDDWEDSFSEFYANEFFTIASCLLIRSKWTISYLLKLADKKLKRSPFSLSRSQNPNARRLDGNVLEVTAAFCVVDASQYSRNSANETFSSFAGQNGVSFVKNIIHNISTQKKVPLFTFSLPEELSAILTSVHVPYLYSVNFSNPVYEEFACFEDGFFVQKYERTSDSEQIDGKFNYRYNQEMYTLTCECKCRKDNIGSGLLLEILEKSIGIHDAKISFVFCRKCIDEPSSNSKFVNDCAANQINVYRVKNASRGAFEVVPFSNIVAEPSHISIIYETDGINLIEG